MQETMGYDIFETMSINELLNIINNYPKLNINEDTTLSDIEKIEEGNYIINELPSISLLEQFPYFMNCKGEILLLKINDLWVMNVSKGEHSYFSKELGPILKDGTNIIINVHSHPSFGKNINVGVPSVNDLKNSNSLNKYIIHDKGVLEYDMSSIENIDKNIIDIMWGKFFYSNPDFKKLSIFEVENLFCDYIGLKRRNISLAEFYSICNVDNITKTR